MLVGDDGVCRNDGFTAGARPQRHSEGGNRTTSGSCFVVAAVVASFCAGVNAQYDFPVDSCACHVHYEMWVQLQLQLSRLLTADFPDMLLELGSFAQDSVMQQECKDPTKIKNELEWTLGPASSGCAAGHLSVYVLCAQQYLLRSNLEAARKYFDFANYLFPMAMPCMDPVIWTITPEAFYDRYIAVVRAADARLHGVDEAHSPVPLTRDEVWELAWRPSPRSV
eukprot:TRINITY_DN13638_c0_g2_i1.p1 TRINITY_DN13638_c0_g2~~TRINITY_DN13638_c0_g2_i1.p1  ORF type:complete len:224 (+),score=32.34 TRINITY_DN13638_c0_g2_i1:200-871(+)